MVRNSIRPKTLLTATAVALVISGGAWAQAAQDTGKAAPTTEAAPIQPGKAMTGPAVQVPTAPGPAAQGEAPKSPAAANPTLAKPPSAPTEQAATGQAPAGQPPTIIAAQKDDQALTSDVVGAKVVTPGGDHLGKVEDLIVGPDGKVQGAVLSVGGFLGIGDKKVAIAWDALKPGDPDQPLVVAMSKDQLEAAPEFTTLADQRARQQAALAPPPSAVPSPGAGSQ